jgi:hypothetical protein
LIKVYLSDERRGKMKLKEFLELFDAEEDEILDTEEVDIGDPLEKVKKNGLALDYVKEQTPEICIAAVEQNGNAIQFVKEQTPEICIAAVSQNGLALRFVKEQTPELCLAAVEQNGLALRYVKEKTPEICLAAVKENLTKCKRANPRNMFSCGKARW